MIIDPKINVRQLALTFKGSKSKRDVESKGFNQIPHDHDGIGQAYFKNDADSMKFGQHLIVEDVLTEIFGMQQIALPPHLLLQEEKLNYSKTEKFEYF